MELDGVSFSKLTSIRDMYLTNNITVPTINVNNLTVGTFHNSNDKPVQIGSISGNGTLNVKALSTQTASTPNLSSQETTGTIGSSWRTMNPSDVVTMPQVYPALLNSSSFSRISGITSQYACQDYCKSDGNCLGYYYTGNMCMVAKILGERIRAVGGFPNTSAITPSNITGGQPITGISTIEQCRDKCSQLNGCVAWQFGTTCNVFNSTNNLAQIYYMRL